MGKSIRITCPPEASSLQAKIADADGNEIEGLMVTQCVIDWETGSPPVATLTVVMPELEVACDSTIGAIIAGDGCKYRVVELID